MQITINAYLNFHSYIAKTLLCHILYDIIITYHNYCGITSSNSGLLGCIDWTTGLRFFSNSTYLGNWLLANVTMKVDFLHVLLLIIIVNITA